MKYFVANVHPPQRRKEKCDERESSQTNVPIDVARIVWIAPESTLWTELVSRLHCGFNLKRNSELLPKVRRWRLNGRHFAARRCLSEEKTDYQRRKQTWHVQTVARRPATSGLLLQLKRMGSIADRTKHSTKNSSSAGSAAGGSTSATGSALRK